MPGLGRPTAALSLVGALWASAARADDTQYAPYPLGGRAVGLGGAFTALADDPSGVYYNPAGLVDVGKSSLQVSTNLYGVELAVGDSVLGAVASALVDLDRVFAELQIIPVAAGGVLGFGDRDGDGLYRHAYALGAFVPDARTLNVQTSAAAASTQDAYRRLVADRTFHAAAAYAYRVDEVWRVGLTGTLSYRTLLDQEQTATRVRLADGRDSFSTTESTISLAVAALRFTFGLKAQLADDVTLGLALSTPSARVWDSASIRLTESRGDPSSGQSRFELIDDARVRGDTRTGTELRVGLARSFPDWSTLSFDLVAYAPTRYQLIEAETAGAVSTLVDRLSLVSEVRRLWVINAAVGYERVIDGDLTWAVGAYTNLSSAPDVPPGSLDDDRLPHIDTLGASATVGLWSEHTATTVGLTGSYGWGRDVLSTQGGAGGDEFRSVEIRQLRVFFFLSSTFMY
jgi:long-chain fatty acid transport protein